MLFARWRSQDLIFLTPYTAAPGFKPTSDSRVAPDWDFWRTLYRLSYSAAAGFQKTKLIKRTRLAPHRWLHFWPASISPMLPIHGQVTFSAGQENEELWRLRNRKVNGTKKLKLNQPDKHVASPYKNPPSVTYSIQSSVLFNNTWRGGPDNSVERLFYWIYRLWLMVPLTAVVAEA